jgi:hypothetical protein
MAITVLKAALRVEVGEESEVVGGGVGIEVNEGVHDEERERWLPSVSIFGA